MVYVVCVVLTVTGLIIGIYGDGQQPGNCRANVERIRDYLVTAGY